jgi:hypothetical protein
LRRLEKAKWPLWLLSVFVISAVAIRAVTQSITINETAPISIGSAVSISLTPHANNHLLNTYLIWALHTRICPE